MSLDVYVFRFKHPPVFTNKVSEVFDYRNLEEPVFIFSIGIKRWLHNMNAPKEFRQCPDSDVPKEFRCQLLLLL